MKIGKLEIGFEPLWCIAVGIAYEGSEIVVIFPFFVIHIEWL